MKTVGANTRLCRTVLTAWCCLHIGCSGQVSDEATPTGGTSGSGHTGGKGNSAGQAPRSDDPVAKDPCAVNARVWAPPRIVRLNSRQYEKVWKTLAPNAQMTGNPFVTVTKYTRFTTDASAGMPELVVDDLLESSETLAKAMLGPTKTAFPCFASATVTSACWREAIAAIGKKIFRRPLSSQEAMDYATAAETSVATAGGLDGGLSMILEVLLSSPFAVFRSELGVGEADAQGRIKLGPHETASALSFAITDAPPTDAIMQAADQGKLSKEDELRALAKQLLSTPDGNKMLLRFLQEYFPYSNAPLVVKDPKEFAFHRPASLVEDSNQFLADLLSKPSGFLKGLLTSQESFVDPLTAPSYGLTATGKTRVKTPLPPGQRAGLLTHPSFLVSFSGTESNEPVQRGRFVRERLLCEDVPPLPIGMVPPLPDLGPSSTLRERLAQHTKGECRACHELMDPLGLVFEQYDHLGRVRTMESGKAVDTTGYVSVDGQEKTPVSGPVALMDYLAASPVVSACVLRNLWEFVGGRPTQDHDSCVVTDAQQAFEKANQNLNEALISLLTSDAFLYRKKPSGLGVKP